MIEIQNTNKDILAKLMATENITVIHKKVPTAYFDVKSRTLCCPILKDDMSPELTDLFMGHEVGHALNTPLEGWHSAVSEKGMMFKGYLNVIEDVRIEKKIKSKYPGLRKSFYAGYKELANNDFFGIRGKTLSELNLIDRINLFYKIGSVTKIEFNDEEQTYINRCEKLETFEEVMELATELFDRQKEITQDKLESMTDQQIEEMIDELGLDDESSDSMSVETDDSNEDDSDQDGSDAKSDDNSEDSDEESNSTDGTDDEAEDEKKSEGDSESKKESEGDSQTGGKTTEEKLEDELNKSISDEAFREKEEELYKEDEYSHEPSYFEIPGKINYEQYIVGWKKINEIMSGKNDDGYGSTYFNRDKIRPHVKEFVDSNKKIINYMVKEFEMKKAAADYKRSWSAKSGELDMSKLPLYQLKDDIFNRVQITPEGKNHGVVMILDWSGSMNGSVKATIEQATLLSMFCRRLAIPFRLFAFSDGYNRDSEYPKEIRDIKKYEERNQAKEEYNSQKMFGSNSIKDQNWSLGTLKMLEIYTDKMSNSEFQTSIENWFQLSESIESRYSYYDDDAPFDREFPCPWSLHLSGTPLDHSIVLMRDYLNDFKTNYNIDICSFITLTDGASHSCFSGSGQLNLIDRKLNRVFKLGGDRHGRRSTHSLLRWLRETTGTRTIGFYITQAKSTQVIWEGQMFCNTKTAVLGEQEEKHKKEFNNLATSFTDGCYDLAILINQKKLKLNYDEDELNVSSGAKKGVLKRALVKAGNSKMKQRVILNKFVGQMAV